jgi:hypothetical protein
MTIMGFFYDKLILYEKAHNLPESDPRKNIKFIYNNKDISSSFEPV